MRSLTLNIFVSYWIAAALVIITFNVVGPPMHRPEFSLALDTLLRTAGSAYADTYEAGGCPQASALLIRARSRVYLIRPDGHVLCGSSDAPAIPELATSTVNSGKMARKFYLERERFAMAVQSRSGAPYVFIMEEPYAQRGLIFGVLTPSYTTIAISGVYTLLLATFLTRPIRRLRLATQQIAKGKLETRVEWGRTPKSGMLFRQDEINGLLYDFNHMADRLQTLVSAQHLLLRDVSHELRSPLTRLRVALELARENSRDGMQVHLDRIERESVHLNTLVSELLSLSFMESVKAVPHPMVFSLSDMLTRLVQDATFEAQSKDRSLSSVILPQCYIRGDETLLRRAVENVLRNAIYYSQKTGEIRLLLTTERREEGNVALIEVLDDGPGIPENQLESIFLPFYRVDQSRSLYTGGFGIGLSIAARALHLHSGSITAKNRPEGGLSVTICLPLTTDSHDELHTVSSQR
jgi:two-component system sensor histidine kinase CpxA